MALRAKACNLAASVPFYKLPPSVSITRFAFKKAYSELHPASKAAGVGGPLPAFDARPRTAYTESEGESQECQIL